MAGFRCFVLAMYALVLLAQSGTSLKLGTGGDLLQQVSALGADVSSITAGAPGQIADIQSTSSSTIDSTNQQITTAVEGLNTEISNLEAQAAAAGKDVSSCVNTANTDLSGIGVSDVLASCGPDGTIAELEGQIADLETTATALVNAETSCVGKNLMNPTEATRCLQGIVDTATAQVNTVQNALGGVVSTVQECSGSAASAAIAQVSDIQATIDACVQEIIGTEV